MPNIAGSDIVYILSPTANDGLVARNVLLDSGIPAEVCMDLYGLCGKIAEGAAALVISEEALNTSSVDTLIKQLSEQPAWSDLPIIVLTGSRLSQAAEVFADAGNIYLLERPFSRTTFVRSVQTALRSRSKQYEVQELLTELRESRDEAERANSAKTQFLANMSHEIRSPIGAIIGFVELLRASNIKEQDKSKYMAVIDRNSQQLLRLIDDILDLAKVESGKLAIEYVSFGLADMLADFVSLMQFKASEKGIRFQCQADSSIPDRIYSDPARLRQILLNIVGNAIKFTGKGGVVLRVSYQDAKLRFRVTDTGIGLTEDQAVNLFQPFVQADSSTTRKFGGTGLGLALSRSLAHALGGQVDLAWSEPGAGSTFNIEISAEPAEGAVMISHGAFALRETVQVPQSIDRVLEGLNVLLVEDSPDNQILISMFLRRAGARFETASDGQEGVDAALRGKFDVVIMDVQMPKMDGHAAVRELRGRGFEKPIVALTAHVMQEERDKCYESGFTDFLTKPIRSDRLVAVLSRYAGKKSRAPATHGEELR